MILLTFVLGILANFLGYIPPGNINLTVVQLSINRGQRQTNYFIASFCLIELVLTFLIVRGAQWLSHTVKLTLYIDWVMVFLFLILGIVTWINRNKQAESHYSGAKAVKLGIVMGFMNPMQIPFWGVMGTYLISHGWIVTGEFGILIFSIGSSIGAGICLLAYSKFAGFVFKKFTLSNQFINKAIAILFFSLAAFQLGKLIIYALK